MTVTTDPSRCYHLGGRPFTAAEHAPLATYTTAEMAAAKAHMQREAEMAA